MLLVAHTSSVRNREVVLNLLSQELIPMRMELRKAQIKVQFERWRDFWRPALPFFGADARLVQRLNRLKRTWQHVIAEPGDLLRQRQYAWRYFGLLHHSLQIARAEPHRASALEAIQRIIAFETFICETAEHAGTCAATSTHRNPLWALSCVGQSSPLPSPRRIPMIRPIGGNSLAYYHYRQAALNSHFDARLLLYPAIDHSHRLASFEPIERTLRLCGSSADPYSKERANLISRRAFSLLFSKDRGKNNALSIIDIGAGTGHLAAHTFRLASLSVDSIHFVDVHPPCSGRSFGMRGCPEDLKAIEWTVADYRQLMDNEDWIGRANHFDIAFVCRLFDNLSTFELCEQPDVCIDVLPHEALSPRTEEVTVNLPASRVSMAGGTALLQDPFRDYFAAIKVLQAGDIFAVAERSRVVPVRRFNPAALTTRDGKSVLAQLLRLAKMIYIDDMDLCEGDLLEHRQRFGLPGTVAVRLIGDGHRTESQSFIIARQAQSSITQVGRRIW